MANSQLAEASVPVQRRGWVISRRADLAFLIGGALAGYLLLFLYAGLHLDMVTVWFVWFVTLDSPHFFATYTRTYLDKAEWLERGSLLRKSFGFFLVGPLVLVGCFGLYALGAEPSNAPFLVLVTAVNLWAYWHVVRQHYGLLMLYKRKNGDVAPLDQRIDSGLLYTGVLAPLTFFIVRNREARTLLGLPLSGTLSPAERVVCAAAASAIAFVVARFAFRQVSLARQGQPLNRQKLLFFAAVIPLHIAACALPSIASVPLLGFVAFVTIHHDIQYLALVHFFLRNRHAKAAAEARPPLLARLSARWPVYLLSAIGVGLCLGFLSCGFNVTPGCTPVLESMQIPLFGAITLRDLLFTIFLGFLMQHYFVDQYIWKVSRDPGLRRDLQLGPSPGAPS